MPYQPHELPPPDAPRTPEEFHLDSIASERLHAEMMGRISMTGAKVEQVRADVLSREILTMQMNWQMLNQRMTRRNMRAINAYKERWIAHGNRVLSTIAPGYRVAVIGDCPVLLYGDQLVVDPHGVVRPPHVQPAPGASSSGPTAPIVPARPFATPPGPSPVAPAPPPASVPAAPPAPSAPATPPAVVPPVPVVPSPSVPSAPPAAPPASMPPSMPKVVPPVAKAPDPAPAKPPTKPAAPAYRVYEFDKKGIQEHFERLIGDLRKRYPSASFSIENQDMGDAHTVTYLAVTIGSARTEFLMYDAKWTSFERREFDDKLLQRRVQFFIEGKADKLENRKFDEPYPTLQRELARMYPALKTRDDFLGELTISDDAGNALQFWEMASPHGGLTMSITRGGKLAEEQRIEGAFTAEEGLRYVRHYMIEKGPTLSERLTTLQKKHGIPDSVRYPLVPLEQKLGLKRDPELTTEERVRRLEEKSAAERDNKILKEWQAKAEAKQREADELTEVFSDSAFPDAVRYRFFDAVYALRESLQKSVKPDELRRAIDEMEKAMKEVREEKERLGKKRAEEEKAKANMPPAAKEYIDDVRRIADILKEHGIVLDEATKSITFPKDRFANYLGKEELVIKPDNLDFALRFNTKEQRLESWQKDGTEWIERQELFKLSPDKNRVLVRVMEQALVEYVGFWKMQYKTQREYDANKGADQHAFERSSLAVRNDLDIAREAIKSNPRLLPYSPAACADKDIALSAIKSNMNYDLLFAAVSDTLKRDPDFAIPLLKSGTLPLKQFPALRGNRDVVVAAVERDGKELRYADDALKKDKEIVLLAMHTKIEAIMFADDALHADRPFLLHVLELHPKAIRYMPLLLERSEENKKLILDGYQGKGGAPLGALPEHWYGDRDIVMAAVRWGDERCWIYADPKFRQDKEFVLEAVKLDGHVLEHVPSFQDDKDIVMAAVMEKQGSLIYISGRLRNDLDVFLAAFQSKHKIISYVLLGCATPELKMNEAFIAAAEKYLGPDVRREILMDDLDILKIRWKMVRDVARSLTDQLSGDWKLEMQLYGNGNYYNVEKDTITLHKQEKSYHILFDFTLSQGRLWMHAGQDSRDGSRKVMYTPEKGVATASEAANLLLERIKAGTL